MRILLLVISLSWVVLAQNGFSLNWFTPDIVTIKPDPFNLVSSNFGQPNGQYSWNTNQWNLMGRQRRTCNNCTQNGKNVVVQNLTLFFNDLEYFIQAVCYNPVPLGIESMQKLGPAPGNGWFTSLWDRDFPIIKSAGANTVRVYNVNPTTRLYTELALANLTTIIQGTLAPPPLGNDHTGFFNKAQQYGIMIIWPLLGDATLMKTLPTITYQRYLMNQIDEIGNHPSLLMYTLGNELNVFVDASLLALVNQYIAFARNYSLQKWGRSIPITNAVVDNPPSYDYLYNNMDVDIFTSNAGYRGLGFSDLWISQTANFSGFAVLANKTKKPNFIGEIGWQQIGNNQTANLPGWFNYKWKDLILKGTFGGCIGGAFFEYLDELYSKADPRQQTMGLVSSRVSSLTDYPATTGAITTGPAGTTGAIITPCVLAPPSQQCNLNTANPYGFLIPQTSLDRCNYINSWYPTGWVGNSSCNTALVAGGDACYNAVLNWRCTTDCGQCQTSSVSNSPLPCQPLCDVVYQNCPQAAALQFCLSFLACSPLTDPTCFQNVTHIHWTNGTETVPIVTATTNPLIPSSTISPSSTTGIISTVCVQASAPQQCNLYDPKGASYLIPQYAVDRCNYINTWYPTQFVGTDPCDTALRAGGDTCFNAILNWRCTTDCGECQNSFVTGSPLPCQPLCDAIYQSCPQAAAVEYCLSFAICSPVTDPTCFQNVTHIHWTNGTETVPIVTATTNPLIPSSTISPSSTTGIISTVCVQASAPQQCNLYDPKGSSYLIPQYAVDRCNYINTWYPTQFVGTDPCDTALRAGGDACFNAILNWRCTTDCGECQNSFVTGSPLPCQPLCDAIYQNCPQAAAVEYCLSFASCSPVTDPTCFQNVTHINWISGSETVPIVTATTNPLIPSSTISPSSTTGIISTVCVQASAPQQCNLYDPKGASYLIPQYAVDRCNYINTWYPTQFVGTDPCDTALRAGGDACINAVLNWRCTTDCGECQNSFVTGSPLPCQPLCDAIYQNCPQAAAVEYCLSFAICSPVTDPTCFQNVTHIHWANGSETVPTVTNQISSVHNSPSPVIANFTTSRQHLLLWMNILISVVFLYSFQH